jgi:hypothetical protein
MKKIIFGLLALIFTVFLCSMGAQTATEGGAGEPPIFISSFIPIILLLALFSLLIFVEIKIGKAIGTRLSRESGLILGIILIVLGVTLFIGIPIIIYSNKGRKKCPYCANNVKEEAIVCQFCGKNLPIEYEVYRKLNDSEKVKSLAIVVNPINRKIDNIKLLGDQLKEKYQSTDISAVFIFDDKNAADLLRDTDENYLSSFFNNHFLATYNRNINTKFHRLFIHLPKEEGGELEVFYQI